MSKLCLPETLYVCVWVNCDNAGWDITEQAISINPAYSNSMTMISGKLHHTQTFPIYSPAVACGKSLTNLIQLKNRLYSSFQIISSFLSSQFRCLQLHLPFRSLWVRKIIFSVLTLYFIRCLKTKSENWVRGYLGSFGFTDIISALPFIPCLSVYIN